MKMFRSIKWRLPLSYATIALLATLTLGLLLLTIVRDYYAEEERLYLTGNAREIGRQVSDALRRGAALETQVPELNNLAFMMQVRVRVLGPNGDELAATNAPDLSDVLIMAASPVSMPVGGSAQGAYEINSAVALPENATIFVFDDPLSPTAVEVYSGTVDTVLPVWDVTSSQFGFSFEDAPTAPQRRSDQVVREPFYDTAGQLLGYVELSQGQAIGSDIVDSVARGWLIASSVAVVLAALVGWLISRRITQPVLQLTAVTQRMAEGDLAQRANVARRDELGTLAHSFNEMADQVEETITALRRFVSDAAHELHSPLTALQTDLELSAGEQDAARRAMLIAQAQQQAVRLRELADNLLDLSRVEAAGQVSFVAVNLNDLLSELSEPYASQADQAGLTLAIDLPQDPIELRGDPAQLRRAIGNLIDNAIKFTPEGGVITIELQKTAAAIELCVQDTGIGIPAEDVPQLFSRFHRGRNVANYPGNGLGLAIVKAIVEAHGGAVSAVNTSPGARFCITFPEAR